MRYRGACLNIVTSNLSILHFQNHWLDDSKRNARNDGGKKKSAVINFEKLMYWNRWTRGGDSKPHDYDNFTVINSFLSTLVYFNCYYSTIKKKKHFYYIITTIKYFTTITTTIITTLLLLLLFTTTAYIFLCLRCFDDFFLLLFWWIPCKIP